MGKKTKVATREEPKVENEEAYQKRVLNLWDDEEYRDKRVYKMIDLFKELQLRKDTTERDVFMAKVEYAGIRWMIFDRAGKIKYPKHDGNMELLETALWDLESRLGVGKKEKNKKQEKPKEAFKEEENEESNEEFEKEKEEEKEEEKEKEKEKEKE